jgi:hypothetical protein
MIIIEQILFYIKEKRFNGKLSDGIISISAGVILLFPKYIRILFF